MSWSNSSECEKTQDQNKGGSFLPQGFTSMPIQTAIFPYATSTIILLSSDDGPLEMNFRASFISARNDGSPSSSLNSGFLSISVTSFRFYYPFLEIPQLSGYVTLVVKHPRLHCFIDTHSQELQSISVHSAETGQHPVPFLTIE